MSMTYLLRHGRTQLSAVHVANGDPSTVVPLDSVGIAQCRRLARAPWTTSITRCFVSQFARTAQTAELILGEPAPPMAIEPALNEIKYGCFEGSPWMIYGRWLRQAGPAARPPGGGESRREAVGRILSGLTACLSAPGPRLVVGHGLMISVVLQLLHHESVDA
jgi:2,3-bisphosphoglycerate-dependent phosphoglycerate mutase